MKTYKNKQWTGTCFYLNKSCKILCIPGKSGYRLESIFSAPRGDSFSGGIMPKVMVIDDEKDTVSVVAMRLEATGYQAITAYDGPTGLKLAMEQKPKLIDRELQDHIIARTKHRK